MYEQGWISVPGMNIECLIDEIPRDLVALFTAAEIRRAERGDRSILELAAPAGTVRRRLELFGVSRPGVLPEFERAKAEAVELHTRMASLKDPGPEKTELEKWVNDAAALTLDSWCAGLRLARHFKVNKSRIKPAHDTMFFLYAIATIAWHSGLWLTLNSCDADEELLVDVTDFVEGGMIRPDELNHDVAVRPFVMNTARYAPVIVLTEGPTDVTILRGGCRVLFPGMADYVRFFDYSMQPKGGAGALTSLVRSMAASGIANRVVAIYDNDAEGSKQYHIVRAAGLPSNIRALRYPELELHRNYPVNTGGTINASGRGAAIELYLGVDALSADGKLPPLHRTQAPGAEQWRLLPEDKVRVQGMFREKLRAALRNGGPLPAHDWSGIAAILEAIFTAFDADSVAGFPRAPNMARITAPLEMP
jgi:hypothetical protein